MNATSRSSPESHALNTLEIIPNIPARVRPGILVVGIVVAFGALVGTGVTSQVAAAAEHEHRLAEGERLAAEIEEATSDETVTEAADAMLANEAQSAIDAAAPVIAAAEGKTDASALVSATASLAQPAALEPGTLFSLVNAVESTIPSVQLAIAEAEAAAAEAERIRVELGNPAGAQAYARQLMASQYGWGADQASCLVNLWQKESGWRWDALNPSSGATGIPQSLPGSKMATHGADWRTNPATQISWGLDYIKRAYGTPCGAWGKSQSVGWY